MAAANTDKFKKLSRRWVGQIGSGGVADASTTTVPLSSATNLATDTAVVVVIDRVDANGVATPSLEETIIGVVSGSNLINCVRGAEGTAQAHNAGAVVEVLVTAKGVNDLIDGLLVEHLQSGRHGSITACSIGINPTGTINDVNGNELLGFNQVASAVNYMVVGNAITASSVTASMAGSDTNIGLDLKMKGTGKFRKPSVIEIPVVASGTNTATGDAKAFFRIPAELNGMNLTGVAAAVYTAGTTGTTDIQIRNKTDTADMLTTKITIDSGETDSSTAATPAVINTSTDDVATGDVIAIDVDATSTTPAQGLVVELRFELP